MWLLADWMSNGMFLTGILLLILIMFRRSSRRYRDRNASDPTSRPTRVTASNRSRSEPPNDVTRWQVEMHELARTLKAELDTKMRLLELLIGQARVESERLRQLLAVLDPSRIAGLESAHADHGQPVSGDVHPRQSDIYTLADAGQTMQEIAERLGTPLGEVEFVLSLRNVSSAAGPRREG